jgi:hypothetical protein
MTGKSKSLKRLMGYDVYRYSGNSRKKDDICIVLGSLVRMKNPEDRNSKADYVGKEGMYFVISYRWSRNQWVYGSIFRNFWQIKANKIVKYAQGLAKTVYYMPHGNLATVGKVIRNDYFERPPTKFKNKK